METPNNKSVRKRLGISRSSSIKKNPLHNLAQNSPLTPSPRVNLNKSVQDSYKEQTETLPNTLCTPLIEKIKLINTPGTPSEVQQEIKPHSSNSSLLSTGCSTIKRKSLSLRSNKCINNQIKKKKLDFIGSSETQEPTPIDNQISFENEFSLAASDSDLELSSMELPSEKILNRQQEFKQSNESDIVNLKTEIHDLEKQIEIFEKRKTEKETLKDLIQLWKRAGIEGLDMLVVKTDPPQSVENILRCFNIPKELLFNPD